MKKNGREVSERAAKSHLIPASMSLSCHDRTAVLRKVDARLKAPRDDKEAKRGLSVEEKGNDDALVMKESGSSAVR